MISIGGVLRVFGSRVSLLSLLTIAAISLDASAVTTCNIAEQKGPEGQAACNQAVNSERQGTEDIPQQCKVSDPDLAGKYTGDCENGAAHGYGHAEGRDTYKGEFKNGEVHGHGTYIWGMQTPWAGQQYEGNHKQGSKHGFGSSSYFPSGKNDSLQRIFKDRGKREGEKYVVRGLWMNNSFSLPCNNREDCSIAEKRGDDLWRASVALIEKGDTKNAIKMLKRSEMAGDARAQGLLGQIHAFGLWGQKKDVETGLPLIYSAASRGSAAAQTTWAFIVIEHSPEEAASMLSSAAHHGDGLAQYKLGLLYETGRGVQKDLVEAKRLYRLAAENEKRGEWNIDAEKRLAELNGTGK